MQKILFMLIAICTISISTAQEKKTERTESEHRKTVKTTTVTKSRKMASDIPTNVNTETDKKQYQNTSGADPILADDPAPGANDPNNTGSVAPRTTDPVPTKVGDPIKAGATDNPTTAPGGTEIIKQ